MSIPLLLSLIALTVSTICLVLLSIVFKHQNLQAEETSRMQATLNNQVNTINEELHEIRSGNYGVSNRLKQLVLEVEQLQSSQQTLVEQDPQSRFYSKGTKLISQGASLEDVMRECDMPAAEAELLFNLHKQK